MSEIVVESQARQRRVGACEGAALGGLRVEEAMNPGVIACGPETPLREVAYTMVASRVHCVIVVSLEAGGARDWGVVSDFDVVAAADQPDAITAGEVAATELVAITADETLERAAQLMVEHEIAHLVVLDNRDDPVGVLSTLDVARAIAGSGRASGRERQLGR